MQKKRKEELARKIKEQEPKVPKTTFRANPVPTFKPVVVKQKKSPNEQKKQTKQDALPEMAAPKVFKESATQTVKVLSCVPRGVPSCGDPERLKQIAEKKQKLEAKYQDVYVPFKAKPAAVLKKPPFQPVPRSKSVEPKLFALQLTERLERRMEFEKKRDNNTEIRRHQEEANQRLKDLGDRRAIRQKAEFHARPNPLGNKPWKAVLRQ